MSKAVRITISDRQRNILDRWVRSKASTPQRLFERCRILLMSAQGVSNSEQSRRLKVDRQRPRRWRMRWAECEEKLADAEREGASEKDLAKLLAGILADAPRPGVTPKFTAEQLTQLIALACEPPEESGRPVTHWTPPELADEATKRGIVESISPRHIDRLLKGGICVHTRASTG
jgi:putative transposase